MPKMYVTIMHYDTQNDQNHTIDMRKTNFEMRMRDANDFIAKQKPKLDAARSVWNIFVAPEYSFASPVKHNNHASGDARHLSEGAKVDIEDWLKTLSVQHPKTLIFPGSIAWKKSLTRPPRSLTAYLQKHNVNPAKPMEMMEAQMRFQVPRQTKAETAIKEHARQFLHDDHKRKVSGGFSSVKHFVDVASQTIYYESGDQSDPMFDGRHWSPDYDKAKKFLHPAPSPRAKLNQLDSGKATYMARNTCLIYLNGVKQAKYSKAQDYHEVLDGKSTVYVPGNSVPTFMVDGKVYGVEICLDHLMDTLKQPERLRGKTPDIVVLMSAQVDFEPDSMPSKAAMAIHACSNQDNNFVGRGGIPLVDSALLFEDPNRFAVYSFDV